MVAASEQNHVVYRQSIHELVAAGVLVERSDGRPGSTRVVEGIHLREPYSGFRPPHSIHIAVYRPGFDVEVELFAAGQVRRRLHDEEEHLRRAAAAERQQPRRIDNQSFHR